MQQQQNELQVKNFIEKCGLSQYYNILIDEGFDRLDSVNFSLQTPLLFFC